MFELRKRSRQVFQRVVRTDVLVLIAILTVVVGLWAFLVVADQVADGETQKFDDGVIRSLRRVDDPAIPVGPRWLEENVRDLTALGGVPVLLIVTTAVVLYLGLSRTYHAMWLVLGSAVGGQLLSVWLKGMFARPRPAVVPHLMRVDFSSFPSGHSMNAAAVYLTLGLLLARLTTYRRLQVYFVSLAILLSVLVGISRVYLGVHYPSDVLAGWTAGSAWAACCWLFAGYLQRQGKVESHTNDPVDSLDSVESPSQKPSF